MTIRKSVIPEGAGAPQGPGAERSGINKTVILGIKAKKWYYFALFYNNRSWTTTFQDDGNDEQQIPDYNVRE